MKILRPRWWVGLLIVAAWLWLFRKPLLSHEVCALRDAGNFYYSLFAWQCSEWGAGRIPLWNPYDGLGVPVLADATSCTFYPGKLLFALPIAFPLRFNLFIAGHVLFAVWSLFFVARRWGASDLAAGIGAMSYAYGGYVLFQHCNLVFLISSSWLPLAVWLGEAMFTSRSPQRAIAFGGTLALMTLGGDPQTAYHTALMAALYALLLWWQEKRAGRAPVRIPGSRWRSSPVLLCLAAGSALGLSAIQVLPSWEWARRSDRSQFDIPPDGIFVAPAVGTHARRTYYYSLGPWRLAEVIWPNLAGRMFPVHRRWLSLLPGEGRVWTPTLYLGLVPVVAAASAWRWRSATPRDRWLMCLVVCGVCGSLGWYGAGWVLQELQRAWPRGLASLPSLSPPVGGLYWLCATLLPGYSYFRYPAKWFVFASLGLSLLAARGCDQVLRGDQRARRCTMILLLLSLALSAAAILARLPFRDWAEAAPPDNLFGPLNAAGAYRDLLSAFVHVAVSAGLIGLAMRATPRRRSLAQVSLVVITALDLVVANQWLIGSVPQSVFASRSRAAELVRESRSLRPGQPPTRTIHDFEFPSAPPAWSQHESVQRLAEIVSWERHSLLCKHHLPFGIALLDSPTTMTPIHWARRLHRLRASPVLVQRLPDRPDATIEWAPFHEDGRGAGPEAGLQVAKRDSGPHVWIEPEVAGAAVPFSATCTFTRCEPQRLEISVETKHSGVLVTSELADPGWMAEVRNKSSAATWSAPTIAVHELFRGVRLPVGSFHVVLRYRPRPFYYGTMITLTTLALVGFFSSSLFLFANNKNLARRSRSATPT